MHPSTRQKIEVVLVRPPLYLTVEEFDLLCAKSVAAGLVPPEFLDRSRRQQARRHVIAELCRRAILASLLGHTRFKSINVQTLAANYPLDAYKRQKLVGARFLCTGCQSDKRRQRTRGTMVRTARRLRDEALEKARRYREENDALRTKLRAALATIEELQGVKKGRAA